MLKKMVLFVLLVTTILRYDLVFNISCFFPENGFYFCILWHLFYIVMSQWLLFQKHFQTLQGLLTDFISLQVSAKLQLKNGMLMEWGKFLSLKLIQIWVCFSGQCYCYYVCVFFNSLKQGTSISSSYRIYSV